MTFIQIAGLIAEHFGVHPDHDADSVTIDSAYFTGKGWRSSRDYRLRATVANLRDLRRAGATAVAVRYDGRIADFQIPEVLRHAERPLFGGWVI